MLYKFTELQPLSIIFLFFTVNHSNILTKVAAVAKMSIAN